MKHSIRILVAYAINRDLDIGENLPEAFDVSNEQKEKMVKAYVLTLQDTLANMIETFAADYIKKNDPHGLFGALVAQGVCIAGLLQICETICGIEHGEIKKEDIMTDEEIKAPQIWGAFKEFNPFN